MPGVVLPTAKACPLCHTAGSINTDQRRGRAFYGCTECGVELGSYVDYGNPYREFNRENGSVACRSHWESTGEERERYETKFCLT